MLVSCPSGLVFEAQEWDLADMSAMARAAEDNLSEEAIATIVSRAWVRTIDPGPYPFISSLDAGFDWKRVTKVDVMWALFTIRAGSFPDDSVRGLTGDDYVFDVDCTNREHKGFDGQYEPFTSQQRVKLSGLKARPLPESTRETMRAGKPLSVKTPSGRTIEYRLPTLEVDAELREHLKDRKRREKLTELPTPGPTDYFGAQASRIEGLKTQDIASRIAFFASRDMTLKQFVPVRDAMVAAGSSIDTKVPVQCPECSRRWVSQLPLQPAFFLPPSPEDDVVGTETGSDGSSSTAPSTASLSAGSSPRTSGTSSTG